MRFILLLVGTFLFQTRGFANETYPHPKFANPDIRSNDNFVTIKAGSFRMGSPSSEIGRSEREGPQHDVTISNDFEMQTTVVTQGQFTLVMGYNPSWCAHTSSCKNDLNNPVEHVSWNEAQELIEKLNAQDAQYQYRLPTEAEWEYSARGGSQSTNWWGNDIQHLDDFVWYYGNSGGQPQPVGKKPANPFGLYDMVGNVFQWVQDWMGDYSETNQTDPVGPAEGMTRVFRGAAFNIRSEGVRTAVRGAIYPNWYHWENLGFRLVRSKK